jgi:hypothetical protein
VLSELTTNQKGAIAETAIVHAAVKLGIEVYRPVVEGGRSDYIFLVGSSLLRVQCKWAARRGAVVIVPCYSARRTRDGLVRRFYGADEIDAFAASCMDVDRCYFLPVGHFPRRSAIQLRLEPSRNNQRAGINWASEYEFAATLPLALGP